MEACLSASCPFQSAVGRSRSAVVCHPKIALTEAIVLEWERTVVVKCRAPQHGPCGHHAFSYIVNVPRMALRSPATHRIDAKVARIDKTNKLGALLVQQS